MSDARRPAPRGTHRALIKKELREVVRDGRFWVIAFAVAGLLVVALAFGFRQSHAVHTERSHAQAGADDHWREQGKKNPHVAAHYGTYVFKPASALSFVDPGVEPYLGASVKLEAHRRNDLEAGRAQDATGLTRFGGLSVAAVLQLLIPLLTIGLGFGAWTAERERGTLRQLASLGLAPRVLAIGKGFGIAAALAALLVPAIALGALAVAIGNEHGAAVSGGRPLAMALAYVAYFVVFVALTLAVSARASSSRGALITLLGFWVFAALIVPRAASDAAAVLAPVPSSRDIADAVKSGVATGLPAGPDREARVATLTEELLETQGFKGAEMLMDAALLSAIELRAEAMFENEIIDHHHERLADAIARRERLAQAAALLSPVVAIRSLSMAFAGTDYAHHRHFADGAEGHRRALVEMLNKEMGDKGGSDAWSFQAGRDLWERAPPFVHRQPSLHWVARNNWLSLASLLGWLGLASLAAWLFARRIRVV